MLNPKVFLFSKVDMLNSKPASSRASIPGLFSAVLCLSLLIGGCEEGDECDLTRLEAARIMCHATRDYCDACAPDAPICAMAPPRSECDTFNPYPDPPWKATDCVDSSHEELCASYVGIIEHTPLIKYDECDSAWTSAWSDGQSECGVWF